MSSNLKAYWAIDRIEGKVAVLERDDGSTAEVPRRVLPKGVREGSVLLVGETAKGEPDWKAAELDEAERGRRVKRAEEALERLRRGDPGGDIVIS